MKTSLLLLASTCLLFPALSCERPASRPDDAPPRAGQKSAAATPAEKGIEFLLKQQNEDGSFPTDIDRSFMKDYFWIGVNTFSALALMTSDKDYSPAVEKTVKFVMDNMSPEGYIVYGKTNKRAPYFEHAMGMLLLSEYLIRYPKRGDPEFPAKVREKLALGVAWTLQAQRENGGWPYRDGNQIIEAIGTALQLDSLRSARSAGIKVPDAVFSKGIALIKGQAEENGGFRCKTVDAPGRIAYEGSTYPIFILEGLNEQKSKEAVNGINYLRNDKGVDEQLKWIPEDPLKPVWTKGGIQLSGVLYTILAFRRAPREEWQKEWFAKVAEKLAAAQKEDGSLPGLYGPVYGTAAAVLIFNIEKPSFHWFN